MKIGIIGVGNVGSTVAYTLLLEKLATELVLIDINEEKVKAEALELRDVAQNYPQEINIIEQNYAELADADVVIISVGPVKIIDMTDRLAELPVTSEIIEDIAPKLKGSGFSGVVISITNPCDVIAHYVQQQTGFSTNKVIGSGAIIDTNRLKNATGRDDVMVIGEHGESQVMVGEVSEREGVQSRSIGWEIFKVKNYTNFGIASCTAKIVRAIVENTWEELNVSSYDKERDTYYATFTKLNRNGVFSRRLPQLTEIELAYLEKSIATIKDNFSNLPFPKDEKED